jgi:DNA-binding transcriptional MerR regulator
MSQIRLYVDEDAAQHAVVDGLRDRGVDVLTILEAGKTSTTDEEQLEFATSQARSIYTLNVDDFCRLHSEFLSQGKEHAGIILIPRQRYSIGEKIRRLMELVESVTAEEMRNRLEFL